MIHKDLHSENILVRQDSIKLADFGLSRWNENDSKKASKLYGAVPYVDPKGLEEKVCLHIY